MQHAPHILQILRPPIELYPPSINQANILVSNGFRVSTVQESRITKYDFDVGLDDRVERFHIKTEEPPSSLLGRISGVLKYRQGVQQFIARLRPDIVLAYDAEAAWAIGNSALRAKSKLAWHFHEIPEYQKHAWTMNIANNYVWRNAQTPNLIIFPDPGRAEIYAHAGRIDKSTIQIVANCPRPVMCLPKPELHEALADRIPQQARVVLYHGAIGSFHGLEMALHSMPQWPSDAFFVAKGRVKSDYAASLYALAKSLGVAHRFILIDSGLQSTVEHYAFVSGATIGWTVLEPVSNAWKYSALASNKRLECMALGVPQISDNGPLLNDLIEGNGCGLCIPHDSIDAAAEAVNRLLTNDSLHAQMAKRARELHLRQYNYDAQFNTVLARLKDMVDTQKYATAAAPTYS